jgi:urate oxidase
MKTTGSGFRGFPRCEWTTLAETDDRILATELTARWQWREPAAACRATSARILEALLEVFAVRFSASVQATLHDMAGAAFAACPEIDRLSLTMPNRHYLPADLRPFGLDGRGISFVPTDAPHGQIEAVFSRE